MQDRRFTALLPLLALGAIACAGPLAPRAEAAEPAETLADPAAWLARRWAATDLAALASAARAWRDERGAWPSDCAAAAARHLHPPPKGDPWGSPYGCRETDGRLVVFSPGPDGKAGTSDDLLLDAGSDAALADAPSAPSAPAAAAPEPPASAEAQRTAQQLAWLGEALESFRRKEGHYPIADKVEHLERWLVAEHLAPAAWSSEDGWGRPLRYRTTDVGVSYTLASAGADGRWEPLAPGAPGLGDAGADLALSDGKLVRWPPGAGPVSPPPARATETPRATEEPKDPLERTRARLTSLAARVAKGVQGGRFPESDDAERLAREMGSPHLGSDGWGRPVHYLSADGGRRFAIVSAGPDGRLAHDMEAYARGAARGGDDVLAREGGLVD